MMRKGRSNGPLASALSFGTLVVLAMMPPSSLAAEEFCPGEPGADPAVIWCDDFESDVPMSEKYYEFDDDDGEFTRTDVSGVAGSHGLRAHWEPGEIDAGHFIYTFGRNPIGSQSRETEDFTEIYWRHYMKLQDGAAGYPDKVSRATIFAGNNWEQAMIAHIWASSQQREYLLMDPATGIDVNGNLVTTTWNDFPNLRWLGAERGETPLDAGRWYCLEAHVRLNSKGNSDGVFEFWIDGNVQASRSDLDWINTWEEYGINALFFSNYWNGGAAAQQERYFDALVISTSRIGCIGRLQPPTNVQVTPVIRTLIE